MAKVTTGQRKAAAGEQARALLKKVDRSGSRFLSAVPQTYDEVEHTVELILSEGSSVERWYGTEALSIDPAAVGLGRMLTSGIPFLDSHNTSGMGSVIGRIADVWFAEGRLMGRAKFAKTPAGEMAEGMVSRGEMTGVSIGYRIDDWVITDAEGTVIDPEKQILNLDDKLTFTASRWELLEVSLVSVPADPGAMVRSNDIAVDGDLRATPLGKGAKEIVVTRGDCSVTYRYGADAPHERAWPATDPQKGNSMAKHNAVRADESAPKDDGSTTPKDDAARKKRKAASRDDDMGDDEMGDRADPTVDADGNYVDDEGNYVDADGEPSDQPVKAVDEADEEDDDGSKSGDRKSRKDADSRAAPAATLTRGQMAEMVRIGEQARRQGVEIDVAAAIERGLKPEALRKRAFDALSKRSEEKGPKSSVSTIRVTRDEREGRAGAMEVALTTQLLASRGSDGIDYSPKKGAEKRFFETHRAQAEQYFGMGFVEIAAECIGHRGNIRTARQSLDIVERAFQSTSDFPAIFQNVLNKTLLARYELAEPTYKDIAVERPFNDFRPHPQVRAGDFPALQPVTQTGELKAGGSLDTGENISVQPYGVIFPISRQMIVNDQLGAIDQILGSAGDTVRVFENTTFFAMFNSNPVLNQDGLSVFAAGHKNLAGSGGVISVTNVGQGRAALRAMRSISQLLLNVPPRIILTGPAQETYADQMVASITPQLTTSVNPFSGKLKSVSDANITDNSWYLLTDPARVPCFIYGFLNGANGPRVRTYEPFGMQGVQISLEHDFGVGAIDFRGAFKNAGALPSS